MEGSGFKIDFICEDRCGRVLCEICRFEFFVHLFRKAHTILVEVDRDVEETGVNC